MITLMLLTAVVAAPPLPPDYGLQTVTGTVTSALLFSVPPCGTPESKTAPACLNWKLAPCPTWEELNRRYPVNRPPGELLRMEDFPPIKPIGCP